MLPQDLIRAAAKVLQEKGWSQTGSSHAAAADGTPVSLWGNTRSVAPIDTSRATINPQAATFSIYGAIVAAHMVDATYLEHAGLMWDCLYRGSRAELGEHAPGGTNYVHPVIAYNEAEGRTKQEVLAFLEKIAAEIEAKLPTGVDTTVVQA